MYFIYSILLALGFLIMSPLFLLRREKYASGFKERLGHYPAFTHDERPVIWLHCVSVGETNAARPLVDAIRENFAGHRLVISTTTQTGQELARTIFKEKADAVVYFPFDFKFSVRRALKTYRPSVVLLMETEIWPRFIREANHSGARIAIVNGRLSNRSASRYSLIGFFISRIFSTIDLALMQGTGDAQRIASLGMPVGQINVTGNIKFDIKNTESEQAITDILAGRFDLPGERTLIIAASTHEPEERSFLEAWCSIANGAVPVRPRLMIVPRHPERFDAIAKLVESFRSDPACEWRDYTFARRSEDESVPDKTADVILLDSIGELRAAYPLAEIVFVGGSLIPHGGQSVLEPAAAGKAVITGPYTHNFTDAIAVFRNNNALIELPASTAAADEIFTTLCDLLENGELRNELGRNAKAVMTANSGATRNTIARLEELLKAGR